MKKRANKKAQELSIGTLVLIVLGIVVLVLLILGFSLGWGNLWDRINIFGGGASLSDVVTACRLAVTAQNKFDYCEKFNKIKTNATEYVNCLDSRVEASLDEKLTCAKAEEGYRKERCKSLKTTDIVNGRVCGDLSQPAGPPTP